MTDRPILFSAPMVRALLDGSKTQKLYAKGGLAPTAPAHLAARLLNGIAEINAHGCWVWGRATSSGYGSMTVARKTVRVHRLVLALSLGRDEASLDEVCHNCPGGDNPLCCNPEHLFEGTHGDNVRDAIAKGRAVPPVAPRLTGESNPAAKLSDDDVAEIRQLRAAGAKQRAIADRFGISPSTVSAIDRGKRRQHA